MVSLSPAHAVVLVVATVLALAEEATAQNNTAIEVCGHDSETCSPVSSGALAATIIVWLFPPVLACCCGSFVLCLKENDIDLRASLRSMKPRHTDPTARPPPAAPVSRRAQLELGTFSGSNRLAGSVELRQLSTRKPETAGHIDVRAAPAAPSPARRRSLGAVRRSRSSSLGGSRPASVEMVSMTTPAQGSDRSVIDSPAPAAAAAADDGPVSVAVGDAGNAVWRCPQCDFDNNGLLSACELCNFARP